MVLSVIDSVGVAGRKDVGICNRAGEGTDREPWGEGGWHSISGARKHFLKVDWSGAPKGGEQRALEGRQPGKDLEVCPRGLRDTVL